MKNKRRYFSLLLCIVLIFSVLSSSCAEEPNPVPLPDSGENAPPEDLDPVPPNNGESDLSQEWPAMSGVTWRYNVMWEEKTYVNESLSIWSFKILRIGGDKDEMGLNQVSLKDVYWSADAMPPDKKTLINYTSEALYMPENYAELWECDSALPAEPYSTVTFRGILYRSSTDVSRSVYDFLESGEDGERTFLIRFAEGYLSHFDTAVERDASVSAWCEMFLPEAEIVEGVGFVRWTGVAEELLTIAADSGSQIWVCFEENFAETYGFTIEQAQALIEKGHLGLWCDAFENSPLYGLTPTEIAAYLAEHPELLEE